MHIFNHKFLKYDEYIHRVVNNNMRKRKKITMERNEIIYDLVSEFKSYSRDLQCENLFHFLKCYSTYCRHDPNIADPNIVDLYEEPVPSVEQDEEPPTIDAL